MWTKPKALLGFIRGISELCYALIGNSPRGVPTRRLNGDRPADGGRIRILIKRTRPVGRKRGRRARERTRRQSKCFVKRK